MVDTPFFEKSSHPINEVETMNTGPSRDIDKQED